MKKKQQPSTLAQQIAKAKKEYDSWTPERQQSVRLEGRSEPKRGGL